MALKTFSREAVIEKCPSPDWPEEGTLQMTFNDNQMEQNDKLKAPNLHKIIYKEFSKSKVKPLQNKLGRMQTGLITRSKSVFSTVFLAFMSWHFFLAIMVLLWLLVAFCSICSGLMVDGALGPTCVALFTVSTFVIFSSACIVYAVLIAWCCL